MENKGNGTISEKDLMFKLVQSKKVMNKVDSGDFARSTPTTNNQLVEDFDFDEYIKTQQPQTTPQPILEEKVNKSKLPDVIKRAMIESPITQISLNDGIDFVSTTKKLMEQEGVLKKPQSGYNKPTPSPQLQKSNRQPSIQNNTLDSSIIAQLTPIIENTIRKVLDEKLNQILTAQQTLSINENLVLKVGDSIFKGKITNVNKAK